MTDEGRVSRRTLLTGAAGGLVVLAAGGAAVALELDHHPGLRSRLFGCGSTPAIPTSSYRITNGRSHSAAMRSDLDWQVALPADHDAGQPLPLVLVLPGLGDDPTTLTTKIGYPGFATRAGLRLGFAAPANGGSTYYHPRRDGTNAFTWVTEEFLPMVEHRFGLGGDRSRRGVLGWSMGGFGALLVAQRRADLVSAAVASSPAVFPSYHDAVTGHSGTFDSPADWQTFGVWEQAGAITGVAVRIDCGDADPFAAASRTLLTRIPGATGGISDGCHDTGFWRRSATAQLRFLAARLA